MARTVTVHEAPRSSAAGDRPGESETPFHSRESVTIGSLESWNTNTALLVLLVKMDQELHGRGRLWRDLGCEPHVGVDNILTAVWV